MLELSARFGILPARVKAAIWAQQHFLEEILPQMTPEMIRLAYELDAKHDKIHPTQDYGLDLEEMEKHFLGEESMYYPGKLISKNPKIIRENMRIKELQSKSKSLPKSVMMETSLFGTKLEEPSEGEVNVRSLEKYNQKDQLTLMKMEKAKKQYEKLVLEDYKPENIMKDKVYSRRAVDHFVVERIMGFGPGQVFIKNWIVNKGKGKMRVNKMFRRTVMESHREDYLPREVIRRNKVFGPRKASLGTGVKA